MYVADIQLMKVVSLEQYARYHAGIVSAEQGTGA